MRDGFPVFAIPPDRVIDSDLINKLAKPPKNWDSKPQWPVSRLYLISRLPRLPHKLNIIVKNKNIR
jgi:hypothetical protein